MAQFTRFPHLPQELQDIVWSTAVSGCSSRTAYLVRLSFRQWHEHIPEGRPDSSEIKLHHVDSLDSNDPFSTLSAMLVTCRQSSAIATAAYRSHVASNLHPFNLHGLRRPIDAHNDVVILHGDWYFRMHFYSVTIGDRIPSKPLRYVGVELPQYMFQPDGNVALITQLSQLYCGVRYLPRWTDLKVLYIIVHPKYLLRFGSERRRERDRWLAQCEVLFRCGNRAFVPLDINILDESDHQLCKAVKLWLDMGQNYQNLAQPNQQGVADYGLATCSLVTWRSFK